MRFFICKHCGNFVGFIHNSGVAMVCCGEELTELVPNTVEASAEKHLPVAAVSGSSLSVQIGSAPHPMENEHHISFVYVETKNGGMRKNLAAGKEPKVSFALSEDDKPAAVYAYCNLHGLWKTEIK
ncbi:MAG: desulfoferrodoxin [Treponema sp.]|nr:desulfoferrodoxin [Treponema sp.]